MAINPTQLVFEQMERVAPELPSWFTKYKVAINYFGKGKSTRVGERDFRIAFKTTTGARIGTYNPNGGAIGRGGYMSGGVGTTTFFPFSCRFELPQLASEVTSSSEVAIKNAFKEALADAVPEFTYFLDAAWHAGYGTPVLGLAKAQATVSGNTVYTLDDGTGAGSINSVGNFNFGIRLLRRGWAVSPYSNDLLTQRAGGPYIISTIDYNTNKVTLLGTVPGASSTDVLCYEGVSGASPTGIQGLPYFVDDTTSGTTLGINRATEPEIQSNSVDASGGLHHQQALQLFHKIFQRRGERAKEIVGLCSDNAQYTIYGEIMNIARYDIDKGNEAKDLLPDVDMSFKFGGVKTILDPHESISTIHWFNPKRWGKATVKELGFYTLAGGGTQYFPLYAGDGSPAAGTWFGLTYLNQYFSDDPGSQGYFKGIPTNSGY